MSKPIPSHLSCTNFTLGAVDDFNFQDRSSISGKSSTHDTAMVLFQDVSSSAQGKPNVSATGLDKRSCKLKTKLPCQKLKFHPKPIARPDLPDDFNVAENEGLILSDSSLKCAKDTQFFTCISYVRNGQPEQEYGLPCWGAFHALISQNKSSNTDDFTDLYPMMGMFYMTKVALCCAGRYITGSVMDDALIETDIWNQDT